MCDSEGWPDMHVRDEREPDSVDISLNVNHSISTHVNHTVSAVVWRVEEAGRAAMRSRRYDCVGGGGMWVRVVAR